MNYPIFNLDYEYTLEEMVRYVRFFNEHKATITVPSDFKLNRTFYSYHQYREDGLLIRFEWKALNKEFTSRETSVEELFAFHKLKDCKLFNYTIITFTGNLIFRQIMPDEQTKDVFFNKIMKKKPRRKYSQKNYEILEYDIKQPNKIPNIFFEFLIEEIQKNIDFEYYYNLTNRNME